MYCVGREKRVEPSYYYYVTSCAGTLRGTGGRGKRVKPTWGERNSRIYSTKSTQSAWGPRNAWIWSQSNGILLLTSHVYYFRLETYNKTIIGFCFWFFPLELYNRTIIGFGFCHMQNYQCLGESYHLTSTLIIFISQ